MAHDNLTVLGATTRIRGRVTGTGDLRLEGSIVGDVSVSGTTAVGSGASVEGDVEAANVTIDGTLIGNVAASGPVTIGDGAVVRGELSGSSVSIASGAEVAVRLNTEFDLDI